jgi:hypothetical protein
MKSISRLIVPALLSLSLSGCLNNEFRFLRLEVNGTVESTEDGAIFIEFHHMQKGQGELGHPLGLIEEIQTPGPGEFEHVLDYPEHAGEGLVVYAWQDADGDEIFCGLGGLDELSGASGISELLDFEETVQVVLDSICLGPERLQSDHSLD